MNIHQWLWFWKPKSYYPFLEKIIWAIWTTVYGPYHILLKNLLIVVVADATFWLWKRQWSNHSPLIGHDGIDFSFMNINTFVQTSITTRYENWLKMRFMDFNSNDWAPIVEKNQKFTSPKATIACHPRGTFIGALSCHVSWRGEYASSWLENLPSLNPPET